MAIKVPCSLQCMHGNVSNELVWMDTQNIHKSTWHVLFALEMHLVAHTT